MDRFDLQQCPAASELLKKAGIHTPAFVEQIAIDSRRIDNKHALFVALPGSRDGHQFLQHAAACGAAYAIVREDCPSLESSMTLLRCSSPLHVLQEIAASYRQQLHTTKFIALAGSYGKTMLKDLLSLILKQDFATAASPDSFNSQIGVPLSILTVTKNDSIALIEAAASQPGEMAALRQIIQPDNGIITHFGKKHLHTMGDMATNVKEILQLFKGLPTDSWLLAPKIPNQDEEALKTRIIHWQEQIESLPHVFVSGSKTDPIPPYTVSFPDGKTFTHTIPAEHHYFIDLLNFALKAAWLLGSNSKSILNVIEHFIPEPTRTEIWQSSLGATFINESTCGDPFSIDNSLRTLQNSTSKGRTIFVFSGLRQGSPSQEQDYKRVGQALSRFPVKKLYLVGKHPFQPLIGELERHQTTTELAHCDDHEQAVTLLRNDARHDDVVLLKGSKKLPFHTLAETFADASCSNLCVINLAAIEWNLKSIKQRLPTHTRLMVIVKAHAYGSDSVRIARFLQSIGIGILGVSYVDEAVVLRRAGIDMPIFVINAPPHEAPKVVKWNLEAGVSSLASVQAIAKEAKMKDKVAKVHLHIDTGMSRFGCRPAEALALAQEIARNEHLLLEGVMTHFACADDPSHDAFTEKQLVIFDKCIEELKKEGIDPPWKHAANSSGAIRFKLPQYNMVRIGLAAWGLHSSEATQESLDLKLALSLISHIEGINICNEGDSVSYGRTYQVKRQQQTFAVLPIGYFDGLHRHYSGKAHVMIRGALAPMVGSICMDYMMVDVTDIPQARVGDPVLIFGTDQYGQFLPPEGLARSGNSIAHELITCLGPRIPRVFIYEEAM